MPAYRNGGMALKTVHMATIQKQLGDKFRVCGECTDGKGDTEG
jgi:hypothetical protein